MSNDSTPKPRSRKAAGRPKKPYRDFPLSPHPGGMWQKKIRGKIHYFGRWARRVNGKLERVEGDGWKEALEAYKAVTDDLHAGRTPRVKADGLTVADLCNRFLTAKLRKQAAGEIGPRMFQDYKDITDRLVAGFGKTRLVDDLAADDFEKLRADMAERWGPVRLGNAITRIKSVFKYGLDNALLERAPRFGSEFKKPDKAVLRRRRAQNGVKMLEADELRRLLNAADVQLPRWSCWASTPGSATTTAPPSPCLPSTSVPDGWIFPARKPASGGAVRSGRRPPPRSVRLWRSARPRRTRRPTPEPCSSSRRDGAGCGTPRTRGRTT